MVGCVAQTLYRISDGPVNPQKGALSDSIIFSSYNTAKSGGGFTKIGNFSKANLGDVGSLGIS